MSEEADDDPQEPKEPFSLAPYQVTTDKIKDTLVKTRGDVLVAAKYLGLRLREFDRMLQAIPGMLAFLGAIEEIKVTNSEYRAWSTEEFERQADRAFALYRLAAIESLYELATMPVSGNAAMMNVKRESSVNLLGKDEKGGANIGELSEFFKKLNDDYAVAAPKVLRIRETLVTLQAGGQSSRSEVILEGEARTVEPR